MNKGICAAANPKSKLSQEILPKSSNCANKCTGQHVLILTFPLRFNNFYNALFSVSCENIGILHNDDTEGMK